MVYGKSKLQEYVNAMVEKCNGIRPAARMLNVNPSVIVNVRNGGDSPTLRKDLGITKYKPRPRIIINCSAELKARYETMRGDISRAEFLEHLLDMADGVLPY